MAPQSLSLLPISVRQGMKHTLHLRKQLRATLLLGKSLPSRFNR
jgi:hypothetical protein